MEKNQNILSVCSWPLGTITVLNNIPSFLKKTSDLFKVFKNLSIYLSIKLCTDHVLRNKLKRRGDVNKTLTSSSLQRELLFLHAVTGHSVRTHTGGRSRLCPFKTQ